MEVPRPIWLSPFLTAFFPWPDGLHFSLLRLLQLPVLSRVGQLVAAPPPVDAVAPLSASPLREWQHAVFQVLASPLSFVAPFAPPKKKLAYLVESISIKKKTYDLLLSRSRL